MVKISRASPQALSQKGLTFQDHRAQGLSISQGHLFTISRSKGFKNFQGCFEGHKVFKGLKAKALDGLIMFQCTFLKLFQKFHG